MTNSKKIYEKIKLIRSHGRISSKNYFNDPQNPDYVDLGYNWRMSSITAALGISQISKLDKIISLRQQNAQFLSSNLSKFSQITVPKTIDGIENIFQMYSILLENHDIRDKLHKFLIEKQIFLSLIRI